MDNFRSKTRGKVSSNSLISLSYYYFGSFVKLNLPEPQFAEFDFVSLYDPYQTVWLAEFKCLLVYTKEENPYIKKVIFGIAIGTIK